MRRTAGHSRSWKARLAKRPKKEIRERVQQTARLLGLEDLLDRRPKQLSGGQKQRVAMGLAIIRQPRVFLMDEPLSNLDAQLRVHMRGEIEALQKRLGVTTVYVTHDQIEAMTMGDRVAVMRSGELQQVDTPTNVYDNPANLFVAGFIGSPEINLFEARYEGGDSITIKGGQTMPLGTPLDVTAGTDIVYGVRPQHITLGESGVPAKVLVVEPTGDAQEVLARVGGEDISVVVRDHALLEPDEVVKLVIDPAKVFIFDKARGLRLR